MPNSVTFHILDFSKMSLLIDFIITYTYSYIIDTYYL